MRRAVYIPCLFSYLRRRVDVGCRGDEEGGKIGGKSEGRRGRGKGMEVGGGGGDPRRNYEEKDGKRKRSWRLELH